MANPSNSVVQNLLPVQAYFNLDGSFNTFIGQGVPFYATANPVQSGLTITNSTLNSSPIGNTSPSTGVFTNIATTTGTISTQPTAATDIVNLLALQSYAAGISWKQPCAVATLTNITLSGLQTIDTYTTLPGDRVLVKDQGTQADNGIYIASAGPWSRAEDANTWNELIAAISFIEYGSQKGGAWFCTAQPGGTLGVTPVIFSQFTTSATYSAGTGLTLTGTVFSITNTGVPASTYGSATATPVFAVNAQGQITSVTNTTITPAIGNVTGLGTNVATFLATPTSANLAAAVSDETGSGALVFATSPTLITPALGTPASGNFTTGTFTWPTFNQNTSGTAAGLSATLAIGSGGTGQTTASTAFNALSPITTIGDMIYGSATNVSSRLAIGTSGQILSVVAGIPAWVNAPSSMVYPGAGIPNSTGSAWGTSYSTTGSGTVLALATSPSFTTPSLGVATATSVTSGTLVANGTITGSSQVGAFSYGTMPIGSADTNIFASFTSSVNSYNQIILQNTNAGASASTDYVVNNNNSTSSAFYGDFGMNSSGWAGTLGTNSMNAPNVVFLQSVSSDLVIGTVTANAIRFVTNSNADNASVSSAGTWTFANTITGSITGNAGTATSATNATNATNIGITDDTTTNATVYPTLVTTTTGNLPVKTASTKFSFNPSTGALSATSFSGSGSGLTGTASSLSIGGSAATVTGATQSSITSASNLATVGTITSGTWSGSFGAVSGANLTTLNASNLSSGTIATARLASGSASSSTYLRGDQTWASVSVSGTAKAYGFINSSSGSSVLSNGFNVSSVTLTGTGQNTITFTNAFANAQYVIVATTNKGDSNNDMNAVVQTGVTGGSRQQTTTQAFLSNGYSSNFQNSQQVSFVVFSN